jgi:hypothetical protein
VNSIVVVRGHDLRHGQAREEGVSEPEPFGVHVSCDRRAEQMIAEAPSPGCFARAKLVRKVQMLVARRAVRVCRRAEVTGVAFFDYFHGQIGVAPNAIELHPILKLLWLGG